MFVRWTILASIYLDERLTNTLIFFFFCFLGGGSIVFFYFDDARLRLFGN